MERASPFRCREFWLPKHGHTAEEYEDAWAVDEDGGRFAVADGATESSFAGEWARLLVGDFLECEGLDVAAWLERVPALQRLWWEAVSQSAVPWNAEEKRNQGAFTTFLGLNLLTDGTWQALAVGDSCLFQVRGGELLTAMPLNDAAQFDNVPWLVGSRQPLTEEWRAEAVHTQKGDWTSGDQFWLLTDAVAQWLLESVHNEGSPHSLALPFDGTTAGFADWVASERTAGKLRNDDCTWLAIDTGP